MVAVLAMVGALWVGQACAQAPKATLEEKRLLATWFEAARLPAKFEKSCVSNPVSLMARSDKQRQMRWLWVCTDKEGNTNTHTMMATASKAMDGTYKSSFLFVFHRTFRVVAIADDNSWMILGTKNHKRLWLFTAKPVVDAETLEQMKSRASAAGFDVKKLMSQPQTNPPQSPRNENGLATVS